MAAVASYVKFVGYKLLEFTDEVIVENGGAITIKSNTENYESMQDSLKRENSFEGQQG